MLDAPSLKFWPWLLPSDLELVIHTTVLSGPVLRKYTWQVSQTWWTWSFRGIVVQVHFCLICPMTLVQWPWTCKSCPGHILGSTQIDRLVIFGNIIIYQISCAWECFVPQLSFNLGLGLVNLGWAISLKLNMIRHVTFPIYLGIPIF